MRITHPRDFTYVKITRKRWIIPIVYDKIIVAK